jgi:hypothetical protein
LPIIAEVLGSVSVVRKGVDATGVGSFLISVTGVGEDAGGALAGRGGAGGSSFLFHMLI